MNRQLIVIFATISLLAFIPSFWIPSFKEWQEARYEVKSLQSKLEESKQYRAYLASKLRDIEEKKDKVEKAKRALPPSPQLSYYLYWLESLASEKQVSLSSVSVQEESVSIENPLLSTSRIVVKLTGDYSSLKDYLTTIENGERLISITKAVFARKLDESGQIRTIELELHLELYSLKL